MKIKYGIVIAVIGLVSFLAGCGSIHLGKIGGDW